MRNKFIYAGIGCLVFVAVVGCIGGVYFFFFQGLFGGGPNDYAYYNDNYYSADDAYYGNDYYYNNAVDDDQPAPSVDIPAGAVGDAAGAFEYTECPFQARSQRITCGYLTAPADHNNPAAGEIYLAVAIIASGQANPGDPPLIYLEGGPGGSALYGGEGLWINSPLGQNRDVILVDQRGTGYSKPSLNCIEYDQAQYENASYAVMDAACRQRLESEGIDLSLYTSAQNAADIQLLRQALGYPEVDLLGVSYGTRLALTVMRDYPQGIRSVILDSVYPPEADSYTEQPLITMMGLELLARDCAQDPDCNGAYPDLFQMLTKVVTDLNKNPATVEFYDYEYDEYYEDQVWGDDVVYAISDAMYSTVVIPYLPAFIGALYMGDYDHAYEILDIPYEDYNGPYYEEAVDLGDAEAMFYAVECYDEAVFTDLNLAEDLVGGYSDVFTDGLLWASEDFLDSCDTWLDVQAGPVEDQPVTSSIPTLLLVGEYDPVTPPNWALGAAEHLSNGQVFVFPGYGHAVIDAGPCPIDMMLDFLADPNQPVNTSCLAAIGPPDFVINP